MLLRSVTKHVKDQNWFAVFVDFLIVVVGVFIGIQVANWNETQANKAGLERSLHRLDKEIELNVEIIDHILKYYDDSEALRTTARLALSNCDTTPENQQALEKSLYLFVEDIQPNFVTVVLEQLNRQDQYQDLFSNKFQDEFGVYTRVLKEEYEQLNSHYNNMWSHHINRHPSINAHFAGVIEKDWYFELAQPFEVVCKDASFRNKFINTIGFFESIGTRLTKTKAKVEMFQLALNKELERN
jgi:hypothetical protein